MNQKELKDKMGNFHNQVIEDIKKSNLTIPQVYIVLEIIREELTEVAKKTYVTVE